MRTTQLSRDQNPKIGTRSRSQSHTDRALILRRFPYGESSLVVHLLTPECGRVAILAKGAYRAKSGYCGVLDLFDTLDLDWSMASGSELGTLRGASIRRRRMRIAGNLDRYRAALSMLEIAGMGARESHEERDLFALLEEGLETLVAAQVAPGLACAVFQLHFLDCQGLAPALEACAACGQQPLDERKLASLVFSHSMGGRLCSNCARQAGPAAKAEAISPALLRVAKSLQDTPFSQLHRFSLEPSQEDRLRNFVRRFLEYHLETRPRISGPPLRSS